MKRIVNVSLVPMNVACDCGLIQLTAECEKDKAGYLIRYDNGTEEWIDIDTFNKLISYKIFDNDTRRSERTAPYNEGIC